MQLFLTGLQQALMQIAHFCWKVDYVLPLDYSKSHVLLIYMLRYRFRSLYSQEVIFRAEPIYREQKAFYQCYHDQIASYLSSGCPQESLISYSLNCHVSSFLCKRVQPISYFCVLNPKQAPTLRVQLRRSCSISQPL